MREFHFHRSVGTPRSTLIAGCAGFVALFSAALFLFLLFGPHGSTRTSVDNIAQFAGPLIMGALCIALGIAAPGGSRTRRWVPILLGLGALGFAIGQAAWAYYELVVNRTTPFPSLADVGFLLAYPFITVGVLLHSSRPLSLLLRVRVALDGLIVMAALVTFSWYFILGPTILQGGESPLAEIVGTAYPVWDLVLIASVLVLAAHARDRQSRTFVGVIVAGLCVIVLADTIFDYQTLQGTYRTGGLGDVGWPLGYMLVGLGALAGRRSSDAAGDRLGAGDREAGEDAGVWGSLLPYTFVPAVGVLLVFVDRIHTDARLSVGVAIGTGAVVALVIARQVLSIIDNRRLYVKLRAKNDELGSANTRLQALATTDPHTDLPNHRALIASLDQELERALRYSRSCAVLVLDLDHFKALNDALGHSAGDAILAEFARVARGALRGIDVLGRWGGEEFIALLPETNVQMAITAAERLRSAVAHHTFTSGGVRLTCSIGVATYPVDTLERDALVEAADRAMYCAKRLGRNQVRWIGDAAVEMLDASVRGDAREQAALIGTVEAVSALVNARDRYTGQHSKSVSDLAVEIARELAADASEAHLIGLAARLHDVGKVAVPDAVLQKMTRPSPEEWEIIRDHARVGAEVVARVPALSVLAPIVRSHHECWDGSGYPDGLAGKAIPFGGRVVAVADSYAAMTTDRPYRDHMTTHHALGIIQQHAGTQFDPDVVAALEAVLARAALDGSAAPLSSLAH